MAKNINYAGLFSIRDSKAANDKRTKLYRIMNGIRIEKKESSKELTVAQATQRLRFGMAVKFALTLKEMIDIGFYVRKKTMTSMNISVKQILRDAIIGKYPSLFIDFSKVILSMGNLEDITMNSMQLSTTGKLELTWLDDRFQEGKCQHDDGVFLFVYNATEEMSFNFMHAAVRSDLAMEIQLPPLSIKDDYHFWIFMASEDRRISSYSTYFNFNKAMV